MMSRISWTAVIALLVGISTVSMLPQADGQNKKDKPKEAARNKAAKKFQHGVDHADRIEAALDQPCKLDFLETPLTEVVKFLSKKFEIHVKIDNRALEDIGVGSKSPITLNVEGISLRSALKLMLTPLDLTWVVRHEIMQITTVDVAGEQLITRVHPVGDLVVIEQQSQPIVVSPFGNQQADFDSLIDLITSTIAPDSWDEGTGPGSVYGFEINGKHALVFSQTDEVHRQVAALLDQLRDIPDHKTKQQADQENTPADKSTSFYQVYPIGGSARAIQEDIAKLVRRAVLPGSWGGKNGAEVLGIAKTIVVKHHAQGQKKVHRFLTDLGVLGFGGGGFGGGGGEGVGKPVAPSK